MQYFVLYLNFIFKLFTQ